MMMFPMGIFDIVQKVIKVAPKVKKAPEKYAFHVKRGATMIGGYTGKTLGGGVGGLVGGVAGGFTKGFMPAAKEGYKGAGGYDPVADFNARAAAMMPSDGKSLIHFPDVSIDTSGISKVLEGFKFPSFPKGGLVNIGKLPDIDVAGGLEMPSLRIPSLDLKDEDGEYSPLMLAALALGGYMLVKKVT